VKLNAYIRLKAFLVTLHHHHLFPGISPTAS
jgi:hypothetical protein